MAKQQVNILDLLQQRSFKKGYTPPAEEVVFAIEDKTIGTLGNFVTFSGLAKAGKSTFLSSTIASAFHAYQNLYGISLRPPGNRKRICYFDTESGESDFYRQLDKVKKQAKIYEFSDNFNAFAVREDSPEMIRQYVEAYLQVFADCSIVIIDGLLDILSNFNDEIESKRTIQWLKMITKVHNVLIIGVIHLARRESQLLGHFGSMLERYSQTVLEVAKDYESGIIVLKPKLMRSDKDFTPIALNWTETGFEKCLPPAPAEMKKAAKK
jgi:hypothetical protein